MNSAHVVCPLVELLGAGLDFFSSCEWLGVWFDLIYSDAMLKLD
jgi:hypothetical protein